MSIYDTNREMIEPGEYVVKVSGYPQEINCGGWTKIEFIFELDGQKPLKQSYFPNQLKSMFQALGFTEVAPGVYDGDIQEAFEKSFMAELFFEDYTKKDGTKGKARRLRNFMAIAKQVTPSPVDWEE